MIQRVLGDRYELEEKIGSGGMADVYKAHDRLLARPVAVKILHEAYRADAEFIERFHREAKAAAKLSHPNIVNIFDVGTAGDDHYIVMEYVPGDTLKTKIQKEGPLDILKAVTIAKDIAAGLAHAHANSIVHCDIKPHNILMTSDGHAKVADFGIARAVTESTMTYSGNVIGSVHYFSPEQARGGAITPKSDVYSLGVTLYEMLANRLPFTGENPVSIAMKHVEEEPVPPGTFRPQVPSMLEAIVLRAMSKNPETRPSSFELVQELTTVESALNVANINDPDATQILPRADVSNLQPRRVARQGMGVRTNEENSQEDSVLEPVKQTFFHSKLFIAGLVVMLTIGFGVGAFMSFGKFWSSEEVIVPDVKGKQLALARQILEDGKLRVNVAETYDGEVAPGQVVSQDPEPGRSVKSGRLVTIYVSKGGEELEMPDLTGLTKSSALERIQKMGLKVGSVYEKEDDANPGVVLSQDPASGKKINRGQNIDLVISRGTSKKDDEKKVQVPDVRNAGLDVAKAGIEGRGLSVGSVTSQVSEQAEGTIVSQSPAPDTEVDEGTTVDLVVAKLAEEPSNESVTFGGEEPFQENSTDVSGVNTEGEISAPSRESGGTKRR